MINRIYPIVHNDTVISSGTRLLSFAQPETLVDLSDGNESGVRFHLDVHGTTGSFDSFKLHCKFQLGMFDVDGSGFSNIRWYDLQKEQIKTMIMEGVDWYTGSVEPVEYVNRMANPSWELNGTGAVDSAGVGGVVVASRPTDGGHKSATRRRTTWTTGTTIVGGGQVIGSDATAVTPGKQYSVSVAINSNKAQRYQVGIRWNNGSTTMSTDFGSSRIVLPNAKMTPIQHTNVTAPEGATYGRIVVQSVDGDGASVWNAGDWLDTDAMIFVEGRQVPTYFDGDTFGASWFGTPHASWSSMIVTNPIEYGVVATSDTSLPITVSRSIKGFGHLVRVYIRPVFVNGSSDAGVTYSLNAVH